ncbi:MAG: hypothetical protein AUG11_01860 [Nitrospirae bacterium 13_1_20CM_2_62_14]|nr:MAG: hypothetical protein AUI96_02135 [Nitrospirae bacterium 13_1_40CM_3_62_11]OLE42227.1 MAG: hypothetical protein AUG11_01860 [Nitrospirae bacterium 13_1_20CM_2_62_14]
MSGNLDSGLCRSLVLWLKFVRWFAAESRLLLPSQMNVRDYYGVASRHGVGDHDDPFAPFALQLDAVVAQLRDQLATLAARLGAVC